ncbi:MAG: hypothetical protein EOR04_05225 [Mesorhizobium sp.]|uniref:hypothetical protein n=1 Tax=Mesorhizobium sp. TaxID=1871066 RepID=UPI000FE62012|nr:hypothetical protein [Mesorhizobium sp.]RWP44325.1 MAG: hypothetical protein EOR04_05225 [Mesorhizobium sp.]
MKIDNVLTAMMIATAMLAGFMMGIVATDTSTIEFWLHRYQTVIAGILAIIAAGWTVFEMRRADERQERRHTDLVHLNIRSDKLKAARAAYEFPEALRQLATDVLGISTKIDKWVAANKGITETSIPVMYDGIKRAIRHVLLMKGITDAQDLFDEKTYSMYQTLLVILEELDPFNDQMEFIASQGTDTRDRRIALKGIKRQLSSFAKALNDFAQSLERQTEMFQ